MQQFERDHERLQQAVEKLEGELATARQAQDALDDQKQENVRAYTQVSRIKRSRFPPSCLTAVAEGDDRQTSVRDRRDAFGRSEVWIPRGWAELHLAYEVARRNNQSKHRA